MGHIVRRAIDVLVSQGFDNLHHALQRPVAMRPGICGDPGRGMTTTVVTGCKFSVAQMLRSSAQIEGDRIRRERCAKKNAWDSEPA
jgi:hypothetical protein